MKLKNDFCIDVVLPFDFNQHQELLMQWHTYILKWNMITEGVIIKYHCIDDSVVLGLMTISKCS